jgi:hypothetical protein
VSCYRMVRYVIGTPGGSGARFRDLEWAAA